MSKTTDFTSYKQQAYLELCLSLVKEAYSDLEKGHFDLAEEQLKEILDMFDKTEIDENSESDIRHVSYSNNVIIFPAGKQTKKPEAN